jgi:hypothetical protein
MWTRFERWLTDPDARYRLPILSVIVLFFVAQTMVGQHQFQRMDWIYDAIGRFLAWVRSGADYAIHQIGQ